MSSTAQAQLFNSIDADTDLNLVLKYRQRCLFVSSLKQCHLYSCVTRWSMKDLITQRKDFILCDRTSFAWLTNKKDQTYQMKRYRTCRYATNNPFHMLTRMCLASFTTPQRHNPPAILQICNRGFVGVIEADSTRRHATKRLGSTGETSRGVSVRQTAMKTKPPFRTR
jgi:hypothetical protein